MPEDKSRPSQDQQPWENGWAPDTSRAPGTRRLWLAGAMALSTIVACVTAIVVTERAADDRLRSAPPAEDTTVPGLISFATPSETTPPKGKSGLSTAQPTPTAPREQDADDPKPAPEPSKSPSHQASSPKPKPQPPATATWRSFRSVNHPDRYWHVSGGYVRLDPIGSGSEQREDATFRQVKGLADPSCYSFLTSDGRYLRHRGFVLVADVNDGSGLFRKDATFCPHYWSASGTLSLESVNYPGRFLRHRDFQIRLDPYENSHQYHSDASFQMVAGLA